MDEAGNISEKSQTITLEGVGNNTAKDRRSNIDGGISIRYNEAQESISIISSTELCKLFIYDILGNLKLTENINGTECTFKLNSNINGVYLIRALDRDGMSKTIKFIK